MSLAIDPDDIVGVLLRGHAEWFTVVEDGDGVLSFSWDAYELVWAAGGADDNLGSHNFVAMGELRPEGGHTGFTFKTNDGTWVSGSMADVLAFKTRRR